MTTEEKDLLLKDLCARLPYGVKVRYSSYEKFITCTLHAINPVYHNVDLWSKNGCFNPVDISKIKPYLFPLSSMTEEQCEELRNLIYGHFTLDDEFNEGIRFKTYGDILIWLDEKPINQCYFIFDWLNKNHFDYRGLIPMGSAIDATGLNIY